MKIEDNVLKKVKDEDIVNGTFVIPENITTIASGAFLDCRELKSIVIPDSVKEIGSEAFINCVNLKSVKLPEGITEIKDSTFKHCLALTNINIPESVKIIGDGAFYYCAYLRKIELSPNLEKIGREAFYKCSALSEVDLPETLESIGVDSFRECKEIRNIVIPSKIKRIPKNAFYFCHNLRKISLPEGLEEIGDHSFFLCTALKNISLPKSLKEIEGGAFKSCGALREIVVPESVFRIGNEVFDDCENLTKVTLSEGLKFLGENCFSGCFWLREIRLPDSLTHIEKGTFKFCPFLKNVHLPKNLTEIPQEMFYRCTHLKKIEIPENVTKIGVEAFGGCKHLKFINLSEGLEIIGEEAFEDCKSLSEIKLPATLKTIQKSAFWNCSKLKELKLPEGIETLKLNFIKGCKKIESLYIPNSIKDFQNPNDSYFEFVEQENNNGFVVLSEPRGDSYLLNSIKVNIPFFFKYKDINPNLLNEQKSDIVVDFYNTFAEQLSEKQLKEFMEDHNFTFFKQIMKLKPETGLINRFNKSGFYKGFYNLGGFKTPAEYNGRVVDYAQKVTGRLIVYIEKDDYHAHDILSHAFETMKVDGFKRGFTDFYLDKIFEIMTENYHNEEFVSRAYNEFEEIQATNTNDHGSQRQLKPTVEKFKNYFIDNKFRNITPETKPIADTISRYFERQDNFDRAVGIMQEFKDKKIPANILSKPLKQENSPFKYIDETSGKVDELQTEILGDLAQIAADEFTYEWLEKNDPTNLILGKLCSCCSHLHGAGYGIMRASIIHPNVQNLVVKNEEGRIIAKSTLFINPEEQYGVMNNFEVYQGVPYLQYKETYHRFMQGVADFAKIYNEEHPDKPLKQINVGGNNNDLLNYVEKGNKKSPELLKALEYSEYGYDVFNYNGDSFADQYIVWKNKDLVNENEITEPTPTEKE